MIAKSFKRIKNNVLIDFEDLSQVEIRYDLFVKYQIKKNQFIEPDFLAKLSVESKYWDAKDKAFDLISRQKHSASELKRKLAQRKFSIEISEKVVNDLVAGGYLSDSNFATDYARELNLKGKSVIYIKQKLISKGINKELIEQVTSEFTNFSDELKNAQIFASKKLNLLSLKNLAKEKLREKMLRSLLAKGFQFEVAQNAVDGLLD